MSTRFGMVRLDTLLTSHHHGTQRVEGVSARKVDRMVAEWDIRKVGTITVSERGDGSQFCIDGANRATAAREVGLTELPGLIHDSLTRQQEAAMFGGLNDFTRPSPISRFLARVDEGEEVAVDVARIVAEHDWRIGQSANSGYVSAVAALERVYRSASGTLPDGRHPEVLDWVLDVITAAWEHDRGSVVDGLLQGVAQLYGRFGSDVDVKGLVKQMSKTRPEVLFGKAKSLRDASGGTIPAHIGKVLVGLHNTNKRTNRLPEWVWTR